MDEPGISPKPAALLSPQLQREKHTETAHLGFNCEFDVDWNDNLDIQDVSGPGLLNMYSRLGMSEHEMKSDMNINTACVTDSPVSASCVFKVSPEQGPVCVKGRLKDHLSFWQRIKANRWVTTIIKDGYALPFVELPTTRAMENHKSAVDDKQFVTEQIKELLSAGCITEANLSEVHVVSPLGVVKNSVKKRLILDLRYVNHFLRIPKFKVPMK